jgi:4-aminobutyrate aminotransferase-like enzyme
LTIKKGKGAIFEDLDGNKYIDFFSSAAVLNTGHAHPKVIAAIKDQLSKNDTSSAEVMRTRVIAPTRTNKQAKEVLDASNQAISSQIKAIY